MERVYRLELVLEFCLGDESRCVLGSKRANADRVPDFSALLPTLVIAVLVHGSGQFDAAMTLVRRKRKRP